MTTERFRHQRELGRGGHGGRKPAQLKAAPLFLEMAQTLPLWPRRRVAEAKTSFQGKKPPENSSGPRQLRMDERGQGPGWDRRWGGTQAAPLAPSPAHLESEDGSGHVKMTRSTPSQPSPNPHRATSQTPSGKSWPLTHPIPSVMLPWSPWAGQHGFLSGPRQGRGTLLEGRSQGPSRRSLLAEQRSEPISPSSKALTLHSLLNQPPQTGWLRKDRNGEPEKLEMKRLPQAITALRALVLLWVKPPRRPGLPWRAE